MSGSIRGFLATATIILFSTLGVLAIGPASATSTWVGGRPRSSGSAQYAKQRPRELNLVFLGGQLQCWWAIP